MSDGCQNYDRGQQGLRKPKTPARVRSSELSSELVRHDDIQLAIDNLLQLSTVARANAAMTMVRNILWQANNDGVLYPDEVEAHIRSVAKDYGCA